LTSRKRLGHTAEVARLVLSGSACRVKHRITCRRHCAPTWRVTSAEPWKGWGTEG
jgi:hypothetical protein